MAHMFIEAATAIQKRSGELSGQAYSPELAKEVIEIYRELGAQQADHSGLVQRDKPVSYRYQDPQTGRLQTGVQYDRNNGYMDYVGRERGDELSKASSALHGLIDRIEQSLTGSETDFIQWLVKATVCCGPLEGRQPKTAIVRDALEKAYGTLPSPALKRALAPAG